MALTLDDAVVKSDDALFRELETEAVLLNLKTGVYYGLNPVGTRAWQLLSEHGRLSRVAGLMLDEFDVERDVLERDLLALGTQLVDSGLCRIQGNS
jgi:hypothetical protein